MHSQWTGTDVKPGVRNKWTRYNIWEELCMVFARAQNQLLWLASGRKMSCCLTCRWLPSWFASLEVNSSSLVSQLKNHTSVCRVTQCLRLGMLVRYLKPWTAEWGKHCLQSPVHTGRTNWVDVGHRLNIPVYVFVVVLWVTCYNKSVNLQS